MRQSRDYQPSEEIYKNSCKGKISTSETAKIAVTCKHEEFVVPYVS